MGFEPTDKGFADLPLRPLGYRAKLLSIAKLLPWAGGLESGRRRRAGYALFFCGRHRRSDFGFAQEAGGFFGRGRVDIKAGTPLKAGNFRELRNDFDVPVVMIVDLFADRRSVDHEVIRRAVEDGVEPHQGVLQHAREARVHGALIVFVGRAVHLGKQPHLERKPRGIRSQRDEMIVFADDALAGVAFLTNDVTKDAALFFIVIVPAAIHLFTHAPGHDGQRD